MACNENQSGCGLFPFEFKLSIRNGVNHYLAMYLPPPVYKTTHFGVCIRQHTRRQRKRMILYKTTRGTWRYMGIRQHGPWGWPLGARGWHVLRPTLQFQAHGGRQEEGKWTCCLICIRQHTGVAAIGMSLYKTTHSDSCDMACCLIHGGG